MKYWSEADTYILNVCKEIVHVFYAIYLPFVSVLLSGSNAIKYDKMYYYYLFICHIHTFSCKR